MEKEFTVVWKYEEATKKQTAVLARMMPMGSKSDLEKKYPYPSYEVQSFGDDPGGVKEGGSYELGYDPLDWE